MDDDQFDDLLAGVDLLPGSSQESLTSAAANPHFDIDSEPAQTTAPTSVDSQDDEDCHATRIEDTFERDQGSHDTEPTAKSPAFDLTPHTVREKIESIFRAVQHTLMSKNGSMCVALRAKPSSGRSEGRLRRIGFPGKTAEEAWRFTVIIRILELMHDAIQHGIVLSKRDLYYRDPALFGSQAVVNRYVDSIAYTFGVPRGELHVTAAAKGLVVGAFNICRRDGSVVDASGEKAGLLVPMLRDVLSIDVSAVNWILVIEKEASFRSISASPFWSSISTHGVIMTGKGYPDIATRALLHFMTTPSPQNGFASPPVYCLVDFDPDGLAIMSTYKDGSAALAHENEDLRVPHMRWLGLRSNSLVASTNDNLHGSQGLLALTARDRRKAINMLDRMDADTADAHISETRNALQTMLMLNTKAELQLLDATPRGIVDLLASKLDIIC